MDVYLQGLQLSIYVQIWMCRLCRINIQGYKPRVNSMLNRLIVIYQAYIIETTNSVIDR